MARVMSHADANDFYVSCQLVLRLELKCLPLKVGGDQEARIEMFSHCLEK